MLVKIKKNLHLWSVDFWASFLSISMKAIVVIILLLVGYFTVTNLPLNEYTKPFVRLIASQVGAKEPFVVDLIDENIKKYYVNDVSIEDDDISKDFIIAMSQASNRSYYSLLQNNLQDMYTENFELNHIKNLTNLYHDLISFWTKLISGAYGTDVGTATEDYFEVINKHKCKLVGFRNAVSSHVINKYPEKEDNARQELFDKYFFAPTHLLFVELRLRTLRDSPPEVAKLMKDRMTDYGPRIAYMVTEILGSKDLCGEVSKID